jgi:hypothetical protein
MEPFKKKIYNKKDFVFRVVPRKKRGSSHTWNATLHGRGALRKGLIERVGDGSSIRVWDDPWIPTNQSLKPLARSPEADVTLVQQLIDEDSATWKMEKLEENFEPNIPIGRFTEDEWAWAYEKSGYFTVRSAYKLLAAPHLQNDNPSTSGVNSTAFLKKLWELKVPPKVCTFWWRVIYEFVPCRRKLKERHMERIGFYKTCGAKEETTYHALFECTWARLFWQEIEKATSIKLPVMHPDS